VSRQSLHIVLARAACAAALAAVAGNALSLSAGRLVGRFDFGYAIRGDRSARPVQVFDDGAGKTYFEVRPGQPMPAVFAGKELEFLAAQPEGQFYTVRTGASEFTLVLGAARARVVRGGASAGGGEAGAASAAGEGRLLASAAPGLPDGVRFEAPAPDASAEAATPPASAGLEVPHAQPIVFSAGSARLGADLRNALSALALRIGPQATIVIEARGDAGRQPGLAESRSAALRDALIASGIPRANISVRSETGPEGREGTAPARVIGALIRWTSAPGQPATPADGPTPPASFDVLPSDQDIAGTLRRWARASGYELVWEVDWVAPVNGQAHVDASTFIDAVRQVSAGLRSQGYPLRAQLYSDRVVRFSAPE
jgi:outer membrane protein OmpA-like peptidoglycan-associated protein